MLPKDHANPTAATICDGPRFRVRVTLAQGVRAIPQSPGEFVTARRRARLSKIYRQAMIF